uniref:Uncharacterized protein n=1 Tax=Brassica oleracea var. oleracea TaxID=109376 RepID=A0A0D3AKJ1_BRAOL
MECVSCSISSVNGDHFAMITGTSAMFHIALRTILFLVTGLLTLNFIVVELIT